MSDQEHRNALPAGYELHWYRLEKVLGKGGFGITYLARDINLERPVAIKEYMPSQISVRENDLSIQPASTEDEDNFKWGLERFISEARTLTKFEHPNLVRVFNIFESNNSAYMVMNYETGKSLKEILKTRESLPEDELSRLLFLLMDGIEAVHEKGFVHRDIKPGNIFIRKDGSPVLLDFGSARQTRGIINTRTLTNFVSPGYAPIEQYTSKSDRQGPWTDIYGLGATAYEAMTGNMPEAAIDRIAMISANAGDNLIKASLICKNRYSKKFLAAIDHALAVNVEERPQNLAEWKKELGVDEAQIDTVKMPALRPDAEVDDVTTEIITMPQTVPVSSRKYPLLISIAAIFCVIIMGIAGFFLLQPVMEETAADDNTQAEAAVVPAEPTEAEVIQSTLLQAREDLEALRLTTPADNNAYDKYRNVLAIDQENADALRGIQLISDKYVQMVYANIESLNLQRAEHYLNKAEQVSPGAPQILVARKTLETTIEEQNKPRTLVGKIKRFFNKGNPD
jgi:serine/threonine protein kinase